MNIPYYPLENKMQSHFKIDTSSEKTVIDYTGLNLHEVFDLPIFDFLILYHDAAIFNMSKTQDGIEYLNNAWRLQQTEPDIDSLRENFGGENNTQ